MVELDVRPLGELMALDVKKLEPERVRRLADLFDELEIEARRLGRADNVENLFGSKLAQELTGCKASRGVEGLWNTIIKKIDYAIADALEFGEEFVESIRSLVLELISRRLARAQEARPRAIRGVEEPRISPPKRTKRAGEGKRQTLLERYARKPILGTLESYVE